MARITAARPIRSGQERRDLLSDRVGEDADGDQRDDPAVVVRGRDDGPHRAAGRPLGRLGHRLAAGAAGANVPTNGLPIRLAFGCE